jgi:hypothetical protein
MKEAELFLDNYAQSVLDQVIRKLLKTFYNPELCCSSLNILTEQLKGYITHLIFLFSLHQHQQTCASEKQEHLSCSWSSFNFGSQPLLHFFNNFLVVHNLKFVKPKFCSYLQYRQQTHFKMLVKLLLPSPLPRDFSHIPVFKTQIAKPSSFDILRMREKTLLRGAAVTSWIFKINNSLSHTDIT